MTLCLPHLNISAPRTCTDYIIKIDIIILIKVIASSYLPYIYPYFADTVQEGE